MAQQSYEHHPLPQPTIWPMVMAAGITIMAAGVVLGFIVGAGGGVLFVLASWGWVRDLLAEHGSATTDDAPHTAGGPVHG